MLTIDWRCLHEVPVGFLSESVTLRVGLFTKSTALFQSFLPVIESTGYERGVDLSTGARDPILEREQTTMEAKRRLLRYAVLQPWKS